MTSSKHAALAALLDRLAGQEMLGFAVSSVTAAPPLAKVGAVKPPPDNVMSASTLTRVGNVKVGAVKPPPADGGVPKGIAKLGSVMVGAVKPPPTI
ncbi:hypothetical protein [Roseomonas sp. AR75]|uniref:hypothetical protein n=1 Tax=Roseomonas sp. AR75 TaxID=2562311 RepID=UPI0010BFADD3|nr:hypothetical protein [Roseomonas sp. AR75]